MEQKEFEERMSSIQTLEAQAAPLKEEIKRSKDSLINGITNLVSLIEARDKSFNDYLNMLKDFNYSDALTTPTDLFPGIRAISDMVDPEELNQKTQVMKDTAITIESKNKNIDALSTHVIQDLKKTLSNLVELTIEENQIYDLCLDLLKDMDSIYDIGQIARATK